MADAGVLNIDNAIATTHSYLQVVELSSVVINSTVHTKWFNRDDVAATSHPTGTDPGAAERPTRKYLYGRGGIPEEAALGINADDNALCTVEYSYRFEKIRPYQLDQPDVGILHVVSTSANDTGLSVTIENADGTNSNTINLDAVDPVGTPTVTGSGAPYTSLGAVHVPNDHDGTVLVYDDDGTGGVDASGNQLPGAAGQLLATVKGNDLYDDIEADSGLPLLGTGSFDTGATLEGKQYAIGAEVFWNNQEFAQYHQGSTVTIGFDISEEPTTNTGLAQVYAPSSRNVEAETTAFGQTVSDDLMNDFLEGKDGVLTYSLTGGDVILPFAHINEGGPGAREDGEAFVMPEVTFVGKRDTVNNREAIEFDRAPA